MIYYLCQDKQMSACNRKYIMAHARLIGYITDKTIINPQFQRKGKWDMFPTRKNRPSKRIYRISI